MISEWFIGIWTNTVIWVSGLIPSLPDFDTAVVGVGAILGPVGMGLTGLGGWIPWPTVAFLLPISVGLYVLGLVLRAVKSLIPTISG